MLRQINFQEYHFVEMLIALVKIIKDTDFESV